MLELISVFVDLKWLFSSSIAEFPALSVCPAYHMAYKEDFLQKYNTTAKNMRKLDYPSSINMTAAEFHKQATHSLEEIVSKTQVKTSKKHPGTQFIKFNFVYGKVKDANEEKYSETMTLGEAEKYWKKGLNYTVLGQCYSFVPPDWIKVLKVLA